MNRTLIANEPLLAPYARKLLELNIRWIEQFLPYATTAGLDNIAEDLGIERDKFRQLFEDLKRKYPHVKLDIPKVRFYLGCKIGRGEDTR